jgi:hypothetical protein
VAAEVVVVVIGEVQQIAHAGIGIVSPVRVVV